MALPFGRATLFGAPGGACRRGDGIGRYFRRSGVAEVCFRKIGGTREKNVPWCPGNFETSGRFSGSGAPGRKICISAPKGKKTEESNRGSGASEKKICCDAPETLQGGALAGNLHVDAPKGCKMGVKMTEAGHTGRKHSLMPRRMI